MKLCRVEDELVASPRIRGGTWKEAGGNGRRGRHATPITRWRGCLSSVMTLALVTLTPALCLYTLLYLPNSPPALSLPPFASYASSPPFSPPPPAFQFGVGLGISSKAPSTQFVLLSSYHSASIKEQQPGASKTCATKPQFSILI